MEIKSLDDKLKQALRDHTETPAEVKKEIWHNLEAELFAEQKETVDMKKQPARFIKYVASVAAALMIILSLQTPTGHAVINQIKAMFVPEKEITQNIEGMEENQNVNLNEGRESSYVVYVDEERYQLIKGDDADRVMPRVPLGENYPEVTMEIKQVEGKEPHVIAQELSLGMKDDFPIFFETREVKDPVTGWMIEGVAGNEWNSPVVKVYVISNQNQGSFVITQRYFLEATEGHGARFDEMLKEFHLVERDIATKQ